MNDTALAEAMTLHQAGRLREAAAIYQGILAADGDDADSLHLLGLITAEQHSPQAGIALIRRAMALKPGCAPHHNSLGHAYRRLGRLEDAACEYQTAAALRPDCAEIHSNLATTLLDLGRHDEAVTQYRLAAAQAPGNADIWYNLANALAAAGPAAETEHCYRTAISLHPAFAAALANYGRWLMQRGRWTEAESHLAESLRLAPGQAGTWNNLGIVSHELGRAEAERCFRAAIGIDPLLADAHYNLGCLLSAHGRTDEAIACHKAALAAEPGFAKARLAACMAQLPLIYRSQREVRRRRQSYAAELKALAGADRLAGAIGTSQPFFLPYQQQDDRALQAEYGRIACRAMAESMPPVALAGPPAFGQRIRIGIVSGFFCDHTLFRLFLEGWLTQLDRSRFEVTGFHTGRTADAITERCAGWCERFVQGLSSVSAWRDAIVSTAPHILLYPEIGIDPVAGGLAAMRLARVQCVAWGQPVTSGMPTIDHYLSSALMEPANADRHYTEKLVRLPNLGLFYTPDGPPGGGGGGAGRGQFGMAEDVPVFWSGQALYKYLPEHDRVFPRIAAELGACQFVFIAFAKSPAVTEAFRDRLSAAFARAGLDAARHVVVLPPLSQQDFVHAAGLADVILDTIGWSGGKSTLDCLAVDPAIVTLPGRFMRGRHTAAILRHIGCEATIAGSLEEYVSIAVRLAKDSVWRAEVRQAVAERKHRAFGDAMYIRVLETFLAGATVMVGEGPQPSRKAECGARHSNPRHGDAAPLPGSTIRFAGSPG